MQLFPPVISKGYIYIYIQVPGEILDTNATRAASLLSFACCMGVCAYYRYLAYQY